MVNIFKYLYVVMATLILVSSLGIWIAMMVKKSAIVTGCEEYLTTEMSGTTKSTSYYSAVTLPNGTNNVHQDECEAATKQLLIVSGVIILIGNFVQVKNLSYT